MTLHGNQCWQCMARTISRKSTHILINKIRHAKAVFDKALSYRKRRSIATVRITYTYSTRVLEYQTCDRVHRNGFSIVFALFIFFFASFEI